MPELTVPDGVTLHWEERGSGPTVLLAPYWNMHPTIFDPIEEILVEDYRVVRFDDRGSGKSDRVGPYDFATGVSDLRAICEETGPVDLALCLVDSTNRAVRIADAEPGLIGRVFSIGSAPFGMGALRDSDSLLSSETVVRTYLQQLEADYRGALRAAIGGANAQLSEDQIRERVQLQFDYADADAAAVRAREWAMDSKAQEPGMRLGSRLTICLSKNMGGPGSWFPSGEEMEPLVREFFPDAELCWVEDGIVSSPRQVAELMALSLETYDRQA
jgi:pimeloyl-ACP methyl ester carboxylesterase